MSERILSGRYRIEEPLGRGGMAEVFKGTDTVLNRPVAIKVLGRQFAEDESFVARFRREAQAAARLNQQNLVSVFDTGSDDGIHYIVMEYVEGRTLADFLAAGGRLMPERAIELTEAVCRALDSAHRQGVVHRDIKPANIMVTRQGEVKVMDFGIARLTSSADTIAQTAAVLGTAAYLSPEQAKGETVDARSDLYSLGVVLYQMVAGRVPFTGDSPVTVAYKHVQEPPEAPSKLNPDVSPELEAVIMRAMAKNPANRYQNAEEFRRDLERARRGQSVEAPHLLPETQTTQLIGRPEPTVVLPPQRPSGPGRRWVVGVLVAILVIAVLGAGLFLLARSILTNGVVKVTVPSLLGYPRDAAESRLKDAGFVPKVEEQVSGRTPGIVIGQDPAGNTLAEKGSTVTITVAKAPPKVAVPNVVGLSQADAEKAITGAHLTVGSISPQADTSTPGTVLSQAPLPDKLVSRGTPVNLVVSLGPGTIFVPNEICQSVGHAQSELSKLGFNVVISDVPGFNADCPQPGKVAAQDPGPGQPASQGDTVTLTESGGSPTPTPTPPPTPTPTSTP